MFPRIICFKNGKCCFYFPNFNFNIQFLDNRVHFGNIYFFPRIMHFQHWKNKDKHLTIKQQSGI